MGLYEEAGESALRAGWRVSFKGIVESFGRVAVAAAYMP
jgi:hypothetical protein